MGGAIKENIEKLGEREFIERLETSLARARKGDERYVEAFKRLDIDADSVGEDVEGEALARRVLSAGEHLDEEVQREVYRTLVGDFEEIRRR